jgi:LPXTG-site transpeptidase (sortase) family protein
MLGLAAGVAYLIANREPPPAPVLEPIVTATISPMAPDAATAAPTATPAREMTDGARFYAPAAGITADIVETYLDGVSWDVSELGSNVGHLQGTAWMNATGNIVLAGHVEMRDGRAGVFARLNALEIGDSIILTQGDQERVYQVRQMFITQPNDLKVLYPTTSDRLTLITCSAYNIVQNVYEERFVVIADRVS